MNDWRHEIKGDDLISRSRRNGVGLSEQRKRDNYDFWVTNYHGECGRCGNHCVPDSCDCFCPTHDGHPDDCGCPDINVYITGGDNTMTDKRLEAVKMINAQYNRYLVTKDSADMARVDLLRQMAFIFGVEVEVLDSRVVLVDNLDSPTLICSNQNDSRTYEKTIYRNVTKLRHNAHIECGNSVFGDCESEAEFAVSSPHLGSIHFCEECLNKEFSSWEVVKDED